MPSAPQRPGRARTRVSASLRARLYGTVVTLTDLLPPRVRYGYVHPTTAKLLRRPLAAIPRDSPVAQGSSTKTRAASDMTAVTCALLTDHLDIGGIGSVIEMLAGALAAHGVTPVILCRGEGRRAARLRDAGVRVESVSTMAEALAALDAVSPDVVELHSAPRYLEEAALTSGIPLVVALHNTEIHYTRAKWRTVQELMTHAQASIAVSDVVRRFHADRVPPEAAAKIVVVPNGAPPLDLAALPTREAARARLSTAIGVPVDDDVVFVCLARYDSQKNIAGTTASFLRYLAHAERPSRLVFAGDPSDWAELRRAEALRDEHPQGDRIHFLGNSDASTLLRAADGFLLNSFFEGWPVAATEAVSAGVPIILSEMGGAAELVRTAAPGSSMIPNPSGDAAAVSDAAVRRARRSSRTQPNAQEFARAAVALAQIPPRGTRAGDELPDTADVMAAEHAAILRAARGGIEPEGAASA
ncbi:glycosyltransferase involved in cell wall biosynthesis [Microbacterium sp. SLBN-146]|nr:glycosyltransferase involved in cell wall biosynthesis [Microbacterium sp. SLBN-146]